MIEPIARKVLELAEKLQWLLYYRDGFDLEPDTRQICERAYRSLKRIVDLAGIESALVYEGAAVGCQFKKRNFTK